jgi:hypothetical protein
MKQETKLPTFIAKWHRNYKVGRTTPKIWFFEDPAFRYIKITKVASTSIEHSLSVLQLAASELPSFGSDQAITLK